MNEWKPIETAPKDGTAVLLNNAESFYYDGGMASSGTFGIPVVARYFSAPWYDGWKDLNDQCIGGDVITHWMPLPNPPEG